MQKKIFRILGAVGTLACLVIFIHSPSFPTPDKLLVFTTFLFMAFGQALESLKRLVPFVGLLLVYESFRGLVPSLNDRVDYTVLPAIDKFLFFGHMPTAALQNWWWDGHVRWFDYLFSLTYTLHFILPLGLALLIWKTRERHYWRYVVTYLTVSFAGFLTFLAFPASPPWLASDKGYIQPIVRVSSKVWDNFGVKQFPSVYNKISPNPVAAMPSLHAAYATLLVLFVYKLYGKKWAALVTIYPLIIYISTVYQGEHYAIDEVAGIIYAFAGYLLVRWVWQRNKWGEAKKATKAVR